MVLELRPAHNPNKDYGFVGVVTSLKDLSASIWMWYRDETTGKTPEWKVKKVIEIPAQPASADDLPPLLKGFGAVPPVVTDLNLSLDDKYLYVSCWGTGELQQYDVSNPHEPRLVGSAKIGGIVNRTAHPSAPDKPLNGAPQMVEVTAGSVAEAIDGLDRRWPGMRDRLCDSTPAIRRHLNIFVEGERARLDSPIPPGGEMIVMTWISGG